MADNNAISGVGAGGAGGGSGSTTKVCQVRTDASFYHWVRTDAAPANTFGDVNLDSLEGDTSFISLTAASDYVTLDPGTYMIEVPVGPWDDSSWVDLKVYDNTGATTEKDHFRVGWAGTALGSFSMSNVKTRVVVASSNQYKFQVRSANAANIYIGTITISKLD